MNKTFKLGLVLAAAVALAAVSPAQAACTLTTQVVFHGLGSHYINCGDAQPMAGNAWLISSPSTVNPGGQDFVCEDGNGSNTIGVPCQLEAGVAGDGFVTIQFDWGIGNQGAVGCPNPNGAGNGTTPIAIQILDFQGNGLITTLGYNESQAGFLVEQGQPLNATGDGADPIACAYLGPKVSSSTPTSVCVNVQPPTIFSDCDAGSVGDALALCQASGATRPTVGVGKLYVRQAACNTVPDARTASGWTALPVVPDAAGNACNTITAAATGTCNYVGNTAIIGGSETPSVVGMFQLTSLAAVDKLKIDSAAFNQGKLVVAFSTQDESTIVGFNVYAGSTKLNTGLIAAKGTGSNAYSFEAARSAVKNNKSVTVEAVTSTGGVIKSAPASVK